MAVLIYTLKNKHVTKSPHVKTYTYNDSGPDAWADKEESRMEEDGDYLKQYEEQPERHLQEAEDVSGAGGEARPDRRRGRRGVQVRRFTGRHHL